MYGIRVFEEPAEAEYLVMIDDRMSHNIDRYLGKRETVEGLAAQPEIRVADCPVLDKIIRRLLK